MKEEFENKTNPNGQGKKISMSLFFLTISVLIIIALMCGGIAVNKNTEIDQLQAKCAAMQEKVSEYDALETEYYAVKAQLKRSNDTIAMLREECKKSKNGKSSGSLLDALLFGAMLGGL